MARCFRASGFFLFMSFNMMFDVHRSNYSLTSRWVAFLCLTVLSLTSPNSWADDKDTSLRLNQGIELRADQQEQEILKDEDYLRGERPSLIIDGQSYTVQHNSNDVGRALYVSLQKKQWSSVKFFLEEYEEFADADPMLLAYARGAIARMEGNLERAETEYRQLIDLKPDFLPGQLELARVLFENRKDAESDKVFGGIQQTLNPGDARQQGVSTTVDSFLQALDKRQSWQGSFSIGPTWVDNLNQSSESYSCLLYFGNVCFYERETPEAVEAHGLDYEATLNKRFALSGHHGVFFRSLLFGQSYKDHSYYNESQITSQLGYSYHTQRNQFSLAPSFDFSRYGHRSMYGAWGLHSEWLHYLSDRVLFKLEADYKNQQYRQEDYAAYNGDIWSAYATAWYVFPDQWTLFGGVDWTKKEAEAEPFAYQQYGIRAGVSKEFSDNISAVLFASVRQRKHDEFNALLGEQREDIEQNYTLIVRFPGLSFYGLEPNLTFKHRKVHSNVNWLYSYDRNSASLKLEKRF